MNWVYIRSSKPEPQIIEKMKKSNGFTLMELIVVIFIIFILVFVIGFGLIGAGMCGNEYYTEEGVLQIIRIEEPKASRVLTSQRNVFSYSEILVEYEDGSRCTYSLDSNILFNYKLKKK